MTDADVNQPEPVFDRIFNIVGALLIFIAVSPFFVILPILIKLDDPSAPVFYRGKRLGRGKQPFTIFKFRSLKVDASRRLGNDLVSSAHNVETRIGSFIRDTRLDELPQLLNVMRGEMNLVGPRPERKEIYESTCKEIPGYDQRFRVRPGVIGYSQVFTPHCTYKRLRSLIDYQFTIQHHRAWQDIKLLATALWILCSRILKRLLRIDRAWNRPEIRVCIHGRELKAYDFNELVVMVRSDPRKICSQYEELKVKLRVGKKTLYFDGVCLQSTLDYFIDEHDGVKRQKRNTVILIERLTPFNEYKFHKYVLRTSIG
jgi:lipopolysaccharide/colanic/teichoic acid biosynthesis glycosyltransferase